MTVAKKNSTWARSLAGSAYKDRVQECAAAVAGVQRRFPRAESLRDVTVEEFESVAGSLPETIARRGRHVVTEIARVGRFVPLLGRL